MIKKLFLIIIIIITLYGMLMYLKPEITSNIEKSIGFPGITEKLTKYKYIYDDVVTNMPTKEELIDTKNKVKEAIDTTKETIDEVRVGAKELEEKYDNAKEFIEETGEKIGDAKEKIGEIKDGLEDLEEIGNNFSNIIGSGTELVDELNSKTSTGETENNY